MTIVRMPLSSLQRPERNVRMHTEKQIREFERSVTMFGQIRPIVVDDKLVILAGNGLYETLIRLGWTEADVLKMDNLSENQKKKLMLADNKIFGLGVDDLEAFDSFLADLQDDLDIPGFDEDLLRSMASQASEVSSTLQEYGTLDSEEIEQLKTAGERKEQFMAAPPQAQPQVIETAAEDSDGEPDETPEPVRRFVVCPHCGEKVWL